jgi:hypothetical protein
MKLNHILTLIILFIYQGLFAIFVSSDQAETLARNFYWERINAKTHIELSQIQVQSVVVELRNGKAAIYHVNFKNGGFVSVAADDAAWPVLAYDFEGQITNENQAPNYSDWLNSRADEIAYIRQHNLSPTNEISQAWQHWSNSQNLQVFGGKSVAPLLHAKWNQDAQYNALSPVDQFGPGGHAYAGCVAVAMAQIMYYYRYPASGIGSHSYTCNYGTLSANFAAATYDYNSMTNTMPPGGNYEIAELLYHCAVAVEMDFSASGSGAWPAMTVISMKQNFGYQNSLALEYKSNFTYAQWVNKIVNNIDSGIPLFYAGYGSGGHAFNLDGYQGSDYFHFNWGWGGAFNGYFYLNALNPGSSSFSNGQQAIFDIYPATNYPSGCNSNTTTLTAKYGTLYDGSGPQDYNPNNNCQWLISPPNIDHLVISFDEIDLAPGDTLTFYDGNSSSAPVLAQAYSGALLSSVSSTNDVVFIRFTSDSTMQGKGFGLSYRSVLPVFCQGTMNLTAATDTFNDGSNSLPYNNGTLCRWYIQPANGEPVRLYFTKFQTEAGKDLIKIYNPATTPSTLLATYSGTQIPPSVYSPSGEMMLVFSSDQANAKDGWEAYYISGPTVGLEEGYKEPMLKLFPNPVNKTLTVEFAGARDLIEVKLYSAGGQLLRRVSGLRGTTQIRLDVSALSEGYYYLRVQTKDGVISRPFIVQHF